MARIYEFFWFVITSILIAALALFIGVAVSGCTGVQHQQRRPTIADTKVQAPVSSQVAEMPGPIVALDPPAQQSPWQPIPQPVVEPLQREERPSRPVQVMNSGGKIIVYEPGKKYSLYCPEFGAITVIMPQGETVLNFNSGNSGEWMVEKTLAGIDLPIGRVAIRRAPYAAPSELHVYTDAAVYQFLLFPQFQTVSKSQQSLFVMVNTDTEARRAEKEAIRREAAERRRREQAERAAIPFDYVQAYRLGSTSGDIISQEGPR